MDQTLRFIGEIRSSLKSLDDCPLQENENAPEATVIILPAYEEGIKDIKAGSEILLVTWLHLADRSVITCVPRHDYDAPLKGVFSTRSPDRPNPIGMHTVKVLSVSANGEIRIAGLEALDKTPVIDIKPLRTTADRRV